MSEGEMIDKIYYDFCRHFFAVDATAMTVKIVDAVAFITISGGARYSCRLTSRGIKKGSWRADHS